MGVGKPRKIKSPKMMMELWEDYKNWCDNQIVITHEFSQRNADFITKELRKKITYTVEGFCVFIGMTRASFYATYQEDEAYQDIVTHMKEECELDARSKFETGQIPSQLAGLWMSKHGYTTKTDAKVEADVGVTIVDDL